MSIKSCHDFIGNSKIVGDKASALKFLISLKYPNKFPSTNRNYSIRLVNHTSICIIHRLGFVQNFSVFTIQIHIITYISLSKRYVITRLLIEKL